MKKIVFSKIAVLSIVLMSCSCDNKAVISTKMLTELPAAFRAFDEVNTTIILEGDEIIIESNGLPNHPSPYWSNTTKRVAIDPRGSVLVTQAATFNHPLFVNPTFTSFGQMAPGNIDDFNGAYTLIVPAIPEKASSTSSTGLGPIGIAVSGSMIYNDEEGPSVPLDDAAPSLDYNGAHTGPQSYHYHLEPLAFSDNDDNLIGIISDGFFLYGRKCVSIGAYPNDLDDSGGHTSITKYNEEEEYHYHIQNELYLNKYYILFPGNYQGSPNAIR
ncbi:YHYH protein [uncultured Cyclobacterium sp.]|uniref:YHYH protein n=1 Tax=uncultured Cyclobacterium sp. TaxID=453820 RepID=UPI0030EF7485|tara:strand:+ start:11496 stop:12311 length:816 start_codon:yes stop_codon:yes gene_type:complete